MRFLKKDKLEILILSFSVVGLITTGVLFFKNNISSTEYSEIDENLGFVRPNGQDIRLRSIESHNWEPIKKETNVFQYDKIFTGQKSSAVIKLKSNQELIIQPNSLIVINQPKKNEKTNEGFFSSLTKKVNTIISKTLETSETISQQKETLQSDNSNETEKVELTIVQGTAQVKNQDGTISELKEKIEIKNEEIIKNEITEQTFYKENIQTELTYPQAGQIFWQQNNYSEIELKWLLNNIEAASKKEIKNSINYQVEISDDPTFSNNSTQIYETSENFKKINLKNGFDYFWRIKIKENDHIKAFTSLTSSFSLYLIKKPQITNQSYFLSNKEASSSLDNLKDSKSIELDKNGQPNKDMTLTWTDDSVSEFYEIQLSKEIEFGQFEKIGLTKSKSFNLNKFSHGLWYYRIASKSSNRDYFNSDPIAIYFKNKVEEKIKEPNLVEKLIDSTIPQEKQEIPSRKVAQEQAQTEEKLNEKSSNSQELTPPDVKKEIVENHSTNDSQKLNHEILPQVKLSQNEVTVETANLTKQPVTISWSKLLQAKNFIVEISNQSDFSNLTEKLKTSDSSINWKPSSFGTSFYRVKAFRDDNTFDNESQISISEVGKIYIKLTPPENFTSVNIEDNSIDKQTFKIKLNWSNIDKPHLTKIQVSLDDKFTENTKNYFTNTNDYTLELNNDTDYFIRAKYVTTENLSLSRYTNNLHIKRISVKNSAIETPTHEENKLEHNTNSNQKNEIEENKIKETLFLQSSEYEFSYGSGFSRLDSSYLSNNAKATALSDMGQNIQFQWKQNWSNKYTSYVNFSNKQWKFLEANEGQLNNRSQNLNTIGFGLIKNTSIFQYGLSLAIKDQLYLPSYESGVGSIDKKSIFGLGLIFNYQLIKYNLFKITTGVDLTYLQSSNNDLYLIKNGLESELKLRLTQKLYNTELFTEANYLIKQQNTSITTESYQEIFFKMGIILFYKDEKNEIAN